jgi:transcriptional regulator with XRE-family HTH domain
LRKSERLNRDEQRRLRGLGGRIRALRDQKNLTLDQFGGLVGVTGATVNRWEKGVLIPDIVDLYRVSEQFNVPLESMLDGYKEKPRKEPYEQITEAVSQLREEIGGRNAAAVIADAADEFLRVIQGKAEVARIRKKAQRTAASRFGPSERRSLEDTPFPLDDYADHIIQDAAPEILEQFRLFVQRRRKP